MKKQGKLICIITFACILLTAVLCSAAAEQDALNWRGYTLKPIWQTSERSEIGAQNLREDGAFVLVRLQPEDNAIDTEIVRENAAADFRLCLSDGENVSPSALMFHNLIAPEDGGFSAGIAPEQDYFDIVFFLKGKDETALDGAVLVMVDDGTEYSAVLASMPQERPEEIPPLSVGFITFDTVVVEVSETSIYKPSLY